MPLLKRKPMKQMDKSEMSDPQSLAIALGVQSQARKKKKMADGGQVEPQKKLGEIINYPGVDKSPSPMPSPKSYAKGGMAMRDESMAQAIMRKRKEKMMAEGGMVELDNHEEPADAFDDLNEEAALKELYDDEQLSADPMDSNEHSVELSDEDSHDMVSAIRRKMRMRKGME